jgi:hypothetical protein
VEEVPAQVVEHGVALREEPVQLLLERRDQEQPLDVGQQPLVVGAEEHLVLVAVVVVEVDVRERRQLLRRRGRLAVVPEHLVLQHVAVALGGVDAEVGETRDREVVPREQPRRAGERLAEQFVHLVARVDEEDAVGEHRVQERRRGGEDAVAESAVRDGDQVLALRRPDDALAGPQLLGGAAVRVGVGAAPSLELLVLPQLGDGVRGRLPSRVPAVHGGFVPAAA